MGFELTCSVLFKQEEDTLSGIHLTFPKTFVYSEVETQL